MSQCNEAMRQWGIASHLDNLAFPAFLKLCQLLHEAKLWCRKLHVARLMPLIEWILYFGRNPPSWKKSLKWKESSNLTQISREESSKLYRCEEPARFIPNKYFLPKTFVFYHHCKQTSNLVMYTSFATHPTPIAQSGCKLKLKRLRSSVQFLVYWIKALVALKDWLANLGGFWLEHWGVCHSRGGYFSSMKRRNIHPCVRGEIRS